MSKNQEWWQAFREGMNTVKEDAYIIGEVWDSPVVVAPYLDKFDSASNFDLAGKLISTAGSESATEIAFILNRTFGLYERASNGSFIDAPFLANHDQNRVMSSLGGNIDHAKIAASLLLTMPGNPFIYYGEEIGMKGMKPDEYIREPMMWDEEAAASVTASTWLASKYNKDTVSAESQMKDPNSLYRHYQQMIAWRKQIPALSNGGIAEFVSYNKADGKVADGEIADGKKVDGKKVDGEKVDGEKVDGKIADVKQANVKQANVKLADVNKAIAAFERMTGKQKVLVSQGKHNSYHYWGLMVVYVIQKSSKLLRMLQELMAI